MSIVSFVDIMEQKRDLAIEIAVVLGEFCVAEKQPLYLLADAVTALEVGVSLLGSRPSRTVEGGRYLPSPIRLLPPIRRPDFKDSELLRSGAEREIGGGLDELIELGLFARREEFPDEPYLVEEPETALHRVIEAKRPKLIVGLGQNSVIWNTIRHGIDSAGGDYFPLLLDIEGFFPDGMKAGYERVQVRGNERRFALGLEGKDSERDEALEDTRRSAWIDGTIVANFMKELTDRLPRKD